MIFRKQHWSWAYLPNAVHEAYGHLVDAIIANGGRGLGQRSEVHSFLREIKFRKFNLVSE